MLGAAYNKIVFGDNTIMNQELVYYVAMSRVTLIEGLFIIHENKNIFKHGMRQKQKNKKLNIKRWDEMMLKNHQLIAISEKLKEELREEYKIKLLWFNVQSWHTHKKDLMKNIIVKQDT